jgi:enediyne polyketide synthase
MAQAARLLTGLPGLPVFENVELQRPVAVPPGRSTTVRVAAFVRDPRRPEVVEVALRDAATGFQSDHFRAVCNLAGTSSAPFLSPSPGGWMGMGEGAGGEGLALDPASDLYGGILFHAGRFRRLRAYRELRATACLAEIAPDGAVPWFGRWLPDELVLGDPGARDAAIHGIQACIPHSTLLPIGVDRVVCGRIENNVPLVLAARERSRHGDEFVYDLEIRGIDGDLRERWEGLRLRAVDRSDLPAVWSSALLGPYVEGRLQEILPGAGVRVALEAGDAVSHLLAGAAVRHRPDGKPEAGEDGSHQISVAHAGDLVLAVSRDGRIGCDLEPVAERSAEVWRGLLGEERFRLAERIAHERGETASAAATRVWAAAESLTKAGVPHGAPLLLEPAVLDRRGADAWVLLRSGRLRVGTFLAPVRELAGPAALAVLVEDSETGAPS